MARVQFLKAVQWPVYSSCRWYNGPCKVPEGGTMACVQFLQAVQWPVYSSCRRYNGPCTVPAGGTMARVQFLQAVQRVCFSICMCYKPVRVTTYEDENHAHNMNVFSSYPP